MYRKTAPPQEAPKSQPQTVGDLRKLLVGVPDDTPVVSIYQPGHDWGPRPARQATPVRMQILTVHRMHEGSLCLPDHDWDLSAYPPVLVLAAGCAAVDDKPL
jgi:hypothetical protein